MPTRVPTRLGQLLVEAGLLDDATLERALDEHRRTGRRLGRVLLDQRVIDGNQLTHALSYQLGLPWVALARQHLTPELLAILPAELTVRCRAIPVFLRKTAEGAAVLYVATDDPTDAAALADCARAAGMQVRAMVAAPDEVSAALDRYHGIPPSGGSRRSGEYEEVEPEILSSDPPGAPTEASASTDAPTEALPAAGAPTEARPTTEALTEARPAPGAAPPAPAPTAAGRSAAALSLAATLPVASSPFARSPVVASLAATLPVASSPSAATRIQAALAAAGARAPVAFVDTRSPPAAAPSEVALTAAPSEVALTDLTPSDTGAAPSAPATVVITPAATVAEPWPEPRVSSAVPSTTLAPHTVAAATQAAASQPATAALPRGPGLHRGTLPSLAQRPEPTRAAAETVREMAAVVPELPEAMLVVGAAAPFLERCRVAAAELGVPIVAAGLRDVRARVQEHRLLALVVMEDLYAFDRLAFTRLALEAGAPLVVWSEELEQEFLEPVVQSIRGGAASRRAGR